jgi:hypothetical protein
MRVPKKTVLPQGWGKMVLYHIHAKHLGAKWNPGAPFPVRVPFCPRRYKTILPQTILGYHSALDGIKPFCPKASGITSSTQEIASSTREIEKKTPYSSKTKDKRINHRPKQR